MMLLQSALVGDKETSSRHLHSHYTKKAFKEFWWYSNFKKHVKRKEMNSESKESNLVIEWHVETDTAGRQH